MVYFCSKKYQAIQKRNKLIKKGTSYNTSTRQVGSTIQAIRTYFIYVYRLECFNSKSVRRVSKSHLGVYSQGDFGNSLNKEPRS